MSVLMVVLMLTFVVGATALPVLVLVNFPALFQHPAFFLFFEAPFFFLFFFSLKEVLEKKFIDQLIIINGSNIG